VIISFVIIRFKLTVDEGHNPDAACSKLLFCSAVNYYWFWCYPLILYMFKSFEKLWIVNIFSQGRSQTGTRRAKPPEK